MIQVLGHSSWKLDDWKSKMASTSQNGHQFIQLLCLFIENQMDWFRFVYKMLKTIIILTAAKMLTLLSWLCSLAQFKMARKTRNWPVVKCVDSGSFRGSYKHRRCASKAIVLAGPIASTAGGLLRVCMVLAMLSSAKDAEHLLWGSSHLRCRHFLCRNNYHIMVW